MERDSNEEDREPVRGPHYDPSYGFEAYWIDGMWILSTRPTGVSDEPYVNCAKKCPAMFYAYGQICARNKEFQYKTFNNYCEMKNYDCLGTYQWMAVRKGVCNTYTGFGNWSAFIGRSIWPSIYSRRPPELP